MLLGRRLGGRDRIIWTCARAVPPTAAQWRRRLLCPADRRAPTTSRERELTATAVWLKADETSPPQATASRECVDRPGAST